MNIHRSRATYFHDTPPPAERVKGQESVEEWTVRTGNKPEQIKNGVENYKTEVTKAQMRRYKNKEQKK